MEKNCINCEHFAWWDGDYCCTNHLKILCPSPDGEMSESMIMALKINKDCRDHKYQDNDAIREMHEEVFEKLKAKL